MIFPLPARSNLGSAVKAAMNQSGFYEFIEAEGIGYTIRLPANSKRPVPAPWRSHLAVSTASC
jgi:hypothetical protein